MKQGSADEMLVELRKATRARLQRPLFPPPGPAVRYSLGSRTETEESDAGNWDVARVSKLLAQLNADSDSNMETDHTPHAATSPATGPVALPSAESSAQTDEKLAAPMKGGVAASGAPAPHLAVSTQGAAAPSGASAPGLPARPIVEQSSAQAQVQAQVQAQAQAQAQVPGTPSVPQGAAAPSGASAPGLPAGPIVEQSSAQAQVQAQVQAQAVAPAQVTGTPSVPQGAAAPSGAPAPGSLSSAESVAASVASSPSPTGPTVEELLALVTGTVQAAVPGTPSAANVGQCRGV